MIELTQCRFVNLGQILKPSDIHQDVKVSQQTLHHMADTMFSHNGQAPDPESAYEDELGADRESLEDIRCTTDTGVIHDVGLVANS